MAAMSINGIKSRIRSVSSTHQITRAMELVSSSKLRLAKERAEKSRPFELALVKAIKDLRAAADACDGESAFLLPRKVKKTCYVVIAGDRGLAGAYNSNLFRRVKELAVEGESCILPIGKKAIEYYGRRDIPKLDVGNLSLADVEIGVCSNIAGILCREYSVGHIDKVVVVYTKFLSMLSQEVREEVLLPIMIEDDAQENSDAGSYLIDDEPIELIDKLVPFCVSGLLYATAAEATASEHGARRNAMSSASKNAEELIADLQLRFNRARQAAITQEITEIVSGADAL